MSVRSVAVVTGAGSGIGRATAERLLADGLGVVAVDVDERALATAASTWPSVQQVAGDVGERSTHERAAAAAAALGSLRAWVNAAGIWIPTRAHDLADDALERTLRVNLIGTVLGCSVACRTWLDLGEPGAIVNIASIEAVTAFPAALAYEASKGGVDAVTRQVAVEYGPAGIRCNSVRPGVVMTAMSESYLRDHDREEMLRSWVELAPLRRVSQPEEVAAAISWLLSDEAAFVTGAALPVDGGATARCFAYPPDPDIAPA